LSQVLVIGNGESRKTINLNDVDSEIKVGCNALFRDFTVEHLVCCDRRMVREALEQNFSKSIHTRDDWLDIFKKYPQVFGVPKIPYLGQLRSDQPFHWGSGSYAVLLGANLGNTVSLLGFDLWGNNNLINNVYKGTDNYLPADKPSVDPNYWIHQISMVFKHFPDKYFIVYNTDSWIMPDRWKMVNVEFKNIDFLTKKL
jgi:hypothetical protein